MPLHFTSHLTTPYYTTPQVSYDYSSESGMLHIYIDNLMLKGLIGEEDEKRGVLAGLKKSFNRFYNSFRK